VFFAGLAMSVLHLDEPPEAAVLRLCFAVTQARSLLMPVFRILKPRRFSFEPTRISQEKTALMG